MEFQETPDAAKLQDLCSQFKALISEIPGVESVAIGRNFQEKSSQYTLVAGIRFVDEAALAAYGPHPRHVATGDLLRPYMKSVLMVDFVPS
jgi:hypothetical protein